MRLLIMKNIPTITINCSRHPSMIGSGMHCSDKINTTGGNTSSYPNGGNHGNSHYGGNSGGGGYSSGGNNKNSGNSSNKNGGNSVSYTGNSNSQGLGKEYNYTEVLGTAGHVAKNVYGHSATVGYIIDFCKKKSGDCWGSNALNHGAGGADSALYVKAINLNSTDMDNNDAGNLFYVLQDFNFNLDIINLSNNKLGNVAVESMIYAITSVQYQTLYSAESGWKPYKSSLKTVQNVISINLSNNQIGDDGAKLLADYLAKGSLPSTKSIDLSGNKIEGAGFNHLMQALEREVVKPITIILDLQDSFKKAVGLIKKATTYYSNKYKESEHGQSFYDKYKYLYTDEAGEYAFCKQLGNEISITGVVTGLAKCTPGILKNTGKTVAQGGGFLFCAAKESIDFDNVGLAAHCVVEVKDVIGETCNSNCEIY